MRLKIRYWGGGGIITVHSGFVKQQSAEFIENSFFRDLHAIR